VRTSIWPAALLLSLGLGTGASAQFGGATGVQTVNRPIDMSGAIAPPPGPRVPQSFGVARFFPRFGWFGNLFTPSSITPPAVPNGAPGGLFRNDLHHVPPTFQTVTVPNR
jgi:hypothetical protein